MAGFWLESTLTDEFGDKIMVFGWRGRKEQLLVQVISRVWEIWMPLSSVNIQLPVMQTSTMKVWKIGIPLYKASVLPTFNPFIPKSDLIDFTLSNAR